MSSIDPEPDDRDETAGSGERSATTDERTTAGGRTDDEASFNPGATADEEPITVEHDVSRFGGILTIVAATIGVGITAPFAVLAIPFGIAGLVMVAGSVFVVGSRRWLSLGVATALLGALITGAYGAAPAELLLVGVGALLVAWDAGHHGFSVAEQLGRHVETKRLEVVHVGLTVLAVGVASMLAYLVFLGSVGGQPASAVALLVTGAIVVMWVFRT